MKAVCDTMMKTLFATVVLCLAAVVFGLAQPAGEQPKGEPDPFGPGAPGGPGEGKAGAKGKADAAPEVVKADPLAIQVLRDSNPTTPLELMRAAQAVLQYGRPDECKRYLAKLLEKPPADDALTALPAKFADLLLRIAKQKEVQPEGKQVADLVMAASQRAAENPERINALVAQLSSANRNERADALVKLAESGRHVVTPLLRVLADAKRAKEFPYVQAALIRLAGATEAPLVGALEGSSDALKAQIALVLGYMKSERATPHLVRLATAGKSAADVREAAQAALMRISGAVPDEHDARQYLANEAARLLRGDLPYEADVENQVELWSWDEAKQEVTSRKLPKADAAVLLASRAAKDWYAVSGDNAAQRMMLLTNLE